MSLQLGKSESDAQAYIQEMIKADMEEAGKEDVFRKIKKDFQMNHMANTGIKGLDLYQYKNDSWYFFWVENY